jgi:hypothetical protein
MMKFKIGQVSVEITMIDWNTKRFVVEVVAPIGNMQVNLVTSINHSEGTPIHIEAEYTDGIPF